MALKCTFYFVLLLSIFSLVENRSFIIDYKNNQFLKDGKPFRYIAGAIHYFRVPEFYWEDRLLKLRAMGANCLQTYIMWNLHEPYESHYDFSGNLNFMKFIRLAGSLNLSVILRIGPYSDAEQDLGGLPAWLLKNPNPYFRSSKDSNYLNAVQKWYGVLLPKVRPLLYRNGGPVITVQIENEYGSYGSDMTYKLWLRNLTWSYLGEKDVVYFTTDGGAVSYLRGGVIPGVYPSVDFAPGANLSETFGSLRQYAPSGPLINSEFYTGWFFYWGQSEFPNERAVENLLKTMSDMWNMNASFNFYLAHGGTNWGYQAGAEYYNQGYVSVTTSYDFRAPISEAGQLTPKYFAIRQTIERLTNKIIPYPVPGRVNLFWYGRIPLQFLGTVFDFLHILCPKEKVVKSRFPLTAEEIDHYNGFILYETTVPRGGARLSGWPIRDRAYIFQDGELVQKVQRTKDEEYVVVPVPLFRGSKLQILVENQGRICYGIRINDDRKGLVGNVTLDGKILENWTIYPINLTNIYHYAEKNWQNLARIARKRQSKFEVGNAENFVPGFYHGMKYLHPEVGDTFFDPSGWGKGFSIINGMNIGRYWPAMGPLVTLYVPKPDLKEHTSVMMFELERAGNCDENGFCTARFIDFPIYKRSADAEYRISSNKSPLE